MSINLSESRKSLASLAGSILQGMSAKKINSVKSPVTTARVRFSQVLHKLEGPAKHYHEAENRRLNILLYTSTFMHYMSKIIVQGCNI